MTSPVVVDGQVTREKRDELLRLGAEHTELEFTSFLDLASPGHLLNLVKTLVGMAPVPADMWWSVRTTASGG